MMDEPEKAKRDFLRAVERRVRQVPGVLSTERIADDFALRIGLAREAAPTTFYVNNLWTEVQRLSPQQRDERIRHYVAALLDLHPEAPQDRESLLQRLRPVLRDLASLRTLPSQPLVHRPALPFLAELLVIDAPHSMSFLPESHLADYQITRDEAFERARQNLTRDTPDLDLGGRSDQPGPVQWQVGDEYESSRLLLTEWLQGIASRADAPLLLAAPERSKLVICLEREANATIQFAERVQADYESASRGVSPSVYVRNGRGVVAPYRPGAEHPAHKVLELGHKKHELASYQAQEEWLATEMPVELAGAKVLPFRVSQPTGNRPAFSWCEWSGTQPVLMPPTEYVRVRSITRWLRRRLECWVRGAELRSQLGADCRVVQGLDPTLSLITRGPGPADAGWLKRCAIPASE